MRIWHHHYGKIALFWALMAAVPLALHVGVSSALEAVLHVMLLEYMSFIILLFALFTVAGGILITGDLRGSPQGNTGILAIGTLLASVIGTTGASMILIRPLLRANAARIYRVHLVVFFIFLVSNIGGALTPLGDPPLFLGFLRGVDFFWTTRALFLDTFLASLALLGGFYLLDGFLARREAGMIGPPAEKLGQDVAPRPFKLFGGINLVLMALIIAAILLSAQWRPGIAIPFPGGEIALQNLCRDVALLLIAGLSLLLTPNPVRAGNEFDWGPILEVAKLFAGIFVCMVPVLAMLGAGREGAFGPLVALVSNPDGTPNNAAYFWLTGILSGFLDNAPTYLVFFELAGGRASELMGPLASTLAAISLGAVFMGALTYIGNAPNLMVAVIARDMKVPMPSFFGYMLWSIGVLGPVLVAIWLVRFSSLWANLG